MSDGRARGVGPPNGAGGLARLPLEILLTIACLAVAAYGLVRELNCLSGGSAHAPYPCVNGSAAFPWYERGLAVSAALAVLGVAAGHWRRSRWLVIASVTLSFAVSVGTLAWGLREVPT